MNRFSAKMRTATGLVALLGCVMILAWALGVVPDEREAIVQGRARFCDAIAVSSSALVSSNDIEALKTTLATFASRNPDVLSAAVRQGDGRFIAVFGEHQKAWLNPGAHAGDPNVFVPIFVRGVQWGTVEVRFHPLSRDGILGVLLRPAVQCFVFVCCMTFVAYLFYLKKVLRPLEPTQGVPQRVRPALDIIAEGLLVLDEQERILVANAAFIAISGRSGEDLHELPASDLPWLEDGRPVDKPWTLALRFGTAQRNVTLQLVDWTGHTRTFVVNAAPVPGPDGNHRCVLVSMEDITVLESQQIELQKTREAAAAAQKAKTEFLARMSHEIRTPMNAIIGFADVLRRGFDESVRERQEYLETLHSSGQNLLDLINDILELSKIDSGRVELELTRCSPHQIVTDVVDMLRARAQEKGIELNHRWQGTGVPETILTDRARLRQVLTNLVGNAIKFTEKGGVTVVTRMVTNDPLSPKVAFDVIDTGIGIKPEALNNLFRVFAQADESIARRFGGAGLGLTVSRQFAEAMGGAITVTSEFGKGSTFTCTVGTGALHDVRILDEPPALQSSRSALPPRLPSLRILSAEDGASDQKLITMVLRRAGAAIVDTADNGQLAVELASKKTYDVILMDMQMPVMDGYSAAGELRRRGIQAPIIALGAHATKSEEDRSLAAGCSAVLPKPIDVDRLVEMVAHQAAENRQIGTATAWTGVDDYAASR